MIIALGKKEGEIFYEDKKMERFVHFKEVLEKSRQLFQNMLEYFVVNVGNYEIAYMLWRFFFRKTINHCYCSRLHGILEILLILTRNLTLMQKVLLRNVPFKRGEISQGEIFQN